MDSGRGRSPPLNCPGESRLLPSAVQVAILGAGLAGAATAHALRRRGVRDVVLLERRAAPGLEASGRNAAILRTAIEDEELAREAALAKPQLEALGVVRRTGGWLVDPAGQEGGDSLAASLPGVRATGRFLPDEGLVDVAALMRLLLANQRVYCGVEVLALVERGHEGLEVSTHAGSLRATTVVNAMGAWAGELGGCPVQPTNRHIFVTPADPRATDDLPWAWVRDNSWYLRAYEGAWMVSACDETPAAAGADALDPQVEALVRERLAHVAPHCTARPFARAWVGQRTFAPGRRPFVEVDATRPALVHAAGLGGHGVTLATRIGERAADLVLARLAAPTP